MDSRSSSFWCLDVCGGDAVWGIGLLRTGLPLIHRRYHELLLYSSDRGRRGRQRHHGLNPWAGQGRVGATIPVFRSSPWLAGCGCYSPGQAGGDMRSVFCPIVSRSGSVPALLTGRRLRRRGRQRWARNQQRKESSPAAGKQADTARGAPERPERPSIHGDRAGSQSRRAKTPSCRKAAGAEEARRMVAARLPSRTCGGTTPAQQKNPGPPGRPRCQTVKAEKRQERSAREETPPLARVNPGCFVIQRRAVHLLADGQAATDHQASGPITGSPPTQSVRKMGGAGTRWSFRSRPARLSSSGSV